MHRFMTVCSGRENKEYQYRCYINWQSLTNLISSWETRNLTRARWTFVRHKITWNKWMVIERDKINSKTLYVAVYHWDPGLRIAFHLLAYCMLKLSISKQSTLGFSVYSGNFCLLWYWSSYVGNDILGKVSKPTFVNSSFVIFSL